MNPYLSVFAMASAFITICTYKRVMFSLGTSNRICFDTFFYKIFFMIIAILVCLRYGDGVDYFSYAWMYTFSPKRLNNVFHYLLTNTPGKIGWKLLYSLFSTIGFPFYLFVVIITIFEFYCLNRFINRYCSKSKVLALLTLFPTLIWTYVMSAMRQGFCMCVFLGIMIELLERKRRTSYVFITLLLSTVHTISLFYLLCLPISSANMCKHKWISIANVSFIIGMLLVLVPSMNTLYLHLPLEVFDHADISVGYGSIIRRVFFEFIIIHIYNRIEKNDMNRMMFTLYMFNCSFFYLFIGMTLISQRMFVLLGEGIETYFISQYIAKKPAKIACSIELLILLFGGFMFIKNINGTNHSGGYRKDITAFNHPYVSIFNRKDITLYRKNIKDELLKSGE